MAELRLKRGFDIRLAGESAPEVETAAKPATVALKPSDFRGVKYRLLVQEGDRVKLGTPLCHSKTREDWVFPALASGTVKAIVRGARRSLQSIVIEPDGKDERLEYQSWKPRELTSLKREEVVQQLLTSGLLCLFRERPFDNVANPEHTPRDIFVSTMDTAPLAADPNIIVQGNENYFQAGLDVCARLTSGQVHLAVDGRRKNVPAAFLQASNVLSHRFSGPHPAGCVGVQMHHISPITSRNDIVWYITVQGLIILGKLFLNGCLDPEITVALAGSSVAEPKYFRTVLGAQINSLVQGRVQDGELRYISGNVLTGRKVEPAGHLGLYDNLITVIPECTEPKLFGWAIPGPGKQSWFPAFLSCLLPGRKFVQDTGLNGGRRAFILSNLYENVLPMDILPVYLAKSCLAEDLDEMEQLGIYEITEEEVALCEYVCPCKSQFQQIIRAGLDLVEHEG